MSCFYQVSTPLRPHKRSDIIRNISGELIVRAFRIGGRLVSCAGHSVQHGARDRYRPQRRSTEENVLTPEHRRR